VGVEILFLTKITHRASTVANSGVLINVSVPAGLLLPRRDARFLLRVPVAGSIMRAMNHIHH
jgi:hypothetical protein